MRSKDGELTRAELTKVVEVMWSFGRSLRYTLRVFDGTGILVEDGERLQMDEPAVSNREPMSCFRTWTHSKLWHVGILIPALSCVYSPHHLQG